MAYFQQWINLAASPSAMIANHVAVPVYSLGVFILIIILFAD